MPKMKSHRGAAKRFRTTGSGRLRRRHNFRNHLLVHKSRKRKRHLGQITDVSSANASAVKRMLAK